MSTRVFFLTKLREGVSPEEYEAWVREADYPVASQEPTVTAYSVARLDGTLAGDGDTRYDYLEVVEVTDLDRYRNAAASNPAIATLLEDWSQYIGESLAVHGTLVDGWF